MFTFFVSVVAFGAGVYVGCVYKNQAILDLQFAKAAVEAELMALKAKFNL